MKTLFLLPILLLSLMALLTAYSDEGQHTSVLKAKQPDENGERSDHVKREEILSVWSTKSDTGGVGVFDRGTFGRVVIFVQKNLYKAVVYQYDWKDASIPKIFQGDRIWGWEDEIRFVPTRYIESKMSDHDSIESFTKKVIEGACTTGEFDRCNQWSPEIYTSIQQEVITCLIENKNEIFTEQQKTYDNKNYDSVRVPEIWKCFSFNQERVFFKKRD